MRDTNGKTRKNSGTGSRNPETRSPETEADQLEASGRNGNLLKYGHKIDLSTPNSLKPRHESHRPKVVRTTVGDLIAAALETGGNSGTVSRLLKEGSPLSRRLRQRLVLVTEPGVGSR